MREAARAVLGHTEHEELVRAGGLFPSDMEAVSVPNRGPFLRVVVDGMLEQVVYEPYVARIVDIQITVVLQIQEEGFPFTAEANGDIEPQALDASVVDTPDENR